MAERVLVVDDEAQITRVLRTALSAQGYDVRAANDPEEALRLFEEWSPDLIVTDLMMPGMSGVELCREIRAIASTPIIVLSVREQEGAKVAALDAGADDYVTKPFSPRELQARVRALLRRMEPTAADSEKPITRGALQLDPASFRVTRDGEALPMSTLEFRLLYFLASHPDRVYSRDQLLDAVWGSERFVTPRSVDVYVRRIRKKVELDPERPAYLKTLRGAGYIFQGRAE